MQQINLYLAEFQPSREPLRAIHMLWIAIAFVLLLALLSYLSQRSNQQMQVQLNQQNAQLLQLDQRLSELKRNQPQANLAQLDEQIAQLSRDLQRRQRLVGIVSSSNLGNSAGFSAQLGALSRQSLDTLSLQAFSLRRGGGYAELLGKTTAGDQVPLYVQRLRSEASFANTAFGVLQIEPALDEPGLLAFSLAEPVAAEDSTGDRSAVQHLLELNEKARSQR